MRVICTRFGIIIVMKKLLTLCLVIQDGKVLLGLKKRGFGEGRWNGFGGKVEEGETVVEAAHRELLEESGVEAKEMEEMGVLEFSFENDPKMLEVHIYKVSDFTGEPIESEEMRPEWFGFDDIPFEQMWSDDKYWFPYLLGGRKFKGNFRFDKPSSTEYQSKILSQELYEVEGF